MSKLKAGLALLTGGVAGLIKYAIAWFNEKVLAKIRNKETAAKYLRDIQAFNVFLGVVIENHGDDLTPGKKVALEDTLAATNELAKALEDFKVDETELDAIVDKITAAIDAWKKAK